MLKETSITEKFIEEKKRKYFKRIALLHYRKDRLLYMMLITNCKVKKSKYMWEMLHIQERIESIYPHIDYLLLIKKNLIDKKFNYN